MTSDLLVVLLIPLGLGGAFLLSFGLVDRRGWMTALGAGCLIALLFGMGSVAGQRRDECEAMGGVWLGREEECVRGIEVVKLR